MTRYNKSEIMKKAHYLRSNYGLNMSAALTQAWKLAKDETRRTEGVGRMRASGFMAMSKGDIHRAFYAKHPTGSIKTNWGVHKVRFTPNGKEYSYGINGIFKLLGLTA